MLTPSLRRFMLLAGLVSGISPFLPVQAIQMVDGTIYFANPPSLGEMVTTEKAVAALSATYFLSISVPPDAGEPLGRVVIQQSEGSDRVWFSANRTTAYLGDNRKNRVTLGPVSQDPHSRAVTVTFAPPIPPGQTVTVALRPRQNPIFSGVYLFGITAYPQGEKAVGQFLGYGRLHLYNSGFFGF